MGGEVVYFMCFKYALDYFRSDKNGFQMRNVSHRENPAVHCKME